MKSPPMLELVGLTSSMLFECKKSRLSDDDHVCKFFADSDDFRIEKQAALNFYCAIKDCKISARFKLDLCS